ncbi:MAG: antibiotic biosynthesis monooxygenase [Deltaproteobacteria bacterium]|nr:antibiotic biosynthesis monooxygenase [Deltaproteobacteria bacterium]MBI4373882.1 antibiotic biosynthesis monooxygenase [Deltaproteobacteria bacterium]
MIIVTACWKSKPGKEADLEKYLQKMVTEVVKQEPKCLQYTLHGSLENPTQFLFYEQYVDKTSFETHKRMPHFKQLLAATEKLLAEPVQVNLYEVIE